MNSSKVIIITGTPGTGKTTISQVLADMIDAIHLEVSRYAEEEGCVLWEDEKRDTSVVDMEKLTALITEMVNSSEKSIILDGHYGHDLVNPSDVEHVLVLRKQPWTLKHVLESRGYSGEKVWENLEAEIVGVSVHEVLSIFPEHVITELDTSTSTPMETVSEALKEFKSQRRNKFTPIDWVVEPETLRLLMKRPCTL